MFTAIVTVLGNLIGGANAGAQAQYAQGRAEYQQSLAYAQAKEMTFYSAYGNSSRALAIIAIIGFLFIGLLVFLALRNN